MNNESMLQAIYEEIVAKHRREPEVIYQQNQAHYDGGPVNPTAGYGDTIPVHIVKDKPDVVVMRGSTSWTGEREFIYPSGKGSTQGPQLLCGANRYRRSVTLIHKGTKNIAIGPSTNITFASNYGSPQMAPNDVLTLETTGDIWAIADPASLGEEINVYQTYEGGGAG